MPGVSDIRLAVSWRDHPKRTKLQRRLGADGVVAVIDLWCWAGEERPSGRLDGMSVEDVEIAAAWRGAPGRLVEELLDLQLLDKDDGGTYVIHSWEDRQGWAVGAARRSESARANAQARWGTAPSSNSGIGRAERMAEARRKGRHAPEEWAKMVAICGGKCVRCGDGGPIVKDHIVPIARGGSDAIDNLQPLCRSCNSSKGPDDADLRPADWRARLDACGMPADSRKMPAECLPTTTAMPADSRKMPAPSPSPSPSLNSLSSRDPSTTGSGHGLHAQPRMFSAGDVERLYSEVTSKTAHPQACAPVAQAIAAAAVSKACDPADLTRKVFAAFPAYRAHCKTLGWDVHPSLRGIDAHIDRLLLWLDGEKPVGQPPGRSPPQASGASRLAPDEKLDPMYRPSVPRVRTAPNCAPASTSAGDAAGIDQPARAGTVASSLSTARSP